MIRFSSILVLVAPFCAWPFIATNIYANSSSSCTAQQVIYDFKLREVPVGNERKLVHKTAQVAIGYMPNPDGMEGVCWPPMQLPKPTPLRSISITIDGYKQELPAKCYNRLAWPIEAVTIRPEDVEILLLIKARSLENSIDPIFLAVYLDPFPERSPFHKEYGFPRMDCDINHEHVWPRDSNLHG